MQQLLQKIAQLTRPHLAYVRVRSQGRQRSTFFYLVRLFGDKIKWATPLWGVALFI